MADLFYPNRFAAGWLSGLALVVGEHGLNEVLAAAHAPQPANTSLERAYPFVHLGGVNNALDLVYGARGGRGMAQRAGRAWFAHSLIGFGSMRGVADPAFRRLEVFDRCRVVLAALATLFTHFSDQHTEFQDRGDQLVLAAHSPFCQGLTAPRPVCHPLAGLVAEAMRWASNGRDLHVRETACRATGHAACIFIVQA